MFFFGDGGRGKGDGTVGGATGGGQADTWADICSAVHMQTGLLTSLPPSLFWMGAAFAGSGSHPTLAWRRGGHYPTQPPVMVQFPHPLPFLHTTFYAYCARHHAPHTTHTHTTLLPPTTTHTRTPGMTTAYSYIVDINRYGGCIQCCDDRTVVMTW